MHFSWLPTLGAYKVLNLNNEIFPLHKTSGGSIRDSRFLKSDQLSERPFMVKRRLAASPYLPSLHFNILTDKILFHVHANRTSKISNGLLVRRNVFHFTQTPELYLAFSKMYTLVNPRGQLGKNLNFLKRVLRYRLRERNFRPTYGHDKGNIFKLLKGVQCLISIQAAFSLFLSVFLSFFLNLSCTQYQHAYKNVLFILLSKMSKDNY